VTQFAFDQLIEAIAGAVVEAETIVRQRQIANILSFFQADGTPNTLDFKIFPPGSDPQTATAQLIKAPALSLVPITSLAIKDMRIEFSTELGALESTPAPPPPSAREGVLRTAAVQLTALGIAPKTTAIAVSPPANARQSSPSTATVKLRVVASDPPEGLARLIDRLNTTI
jgi:hypothetical protein